MKNAKEILLIHIELHFKSTESQKCEKFHENDLIYLNIVPYTVQV